MVKVKDKAITLSDHVFLFLTTAMRDTFKMQRINKMKLYLISKLMLVTGAKL